MSPTSQPIALSVKPLDVQILPIFDDNYVFVITRPDQQTCVIVDPGDADPVQDFLRQKSLKLEAILLTHHHDDHIGGAFALKEQWKVPVYAPLKNQTQIPFATDYVVDGQTFALLGGTLDLKVIELPGHTLGHIAFFDGHRKWLFSGDVLFGLGCGRLFEGTFAQAYETLKRLKALPDETTVFCTHEYTESNLRFCKSLTPAESPEMALRARELDSYAATVAQKRGAGQPTVPLNLGTEKSVNPFLLADGLERFTFLRELKNRR